MLEPTHKKGIIHLNLVCPDLNKHEIYRNSVPNQLQIADHLFFLSSMGIEKAGISQVVSEQWAYNLFRSPLLRNYMMGMYQLVHSIHFQRPIGLTNITKLPEPGVLCGNITYFGVVADHLSKPGKQFLSNGHVQHSDPLLRN